MMVVCIRPLSRNSPVVVKQTVNELSGCIATDNATVGTVFCYHFIVNKLATDKFHRIIEDGCTARLSDIDGATISPAVFMLHFVIFEDTVPEDRPCVS